MLYEIGNANFHEYGLYPFFLIYHAWYSLEVDNSNHYYEGLNLNNAYQMLCEEAKYWIEVYINNRNPLNMIALDQSININTQSNYIELEKEIT